MAGRAANHPLPNSSEEDWMKDVHSVDSNNLNWQQRVCNWWRSWKKKRPVAAAFLVVLFPALLQSCVNNATEIAKPIVIENPGSFLDGITPANIITHPSKPRNKFIAETLQRLKYVQRTGQGVDIIYKEMVSMGKSYPEYNLFDEAVTLTLKSSIVSTEFVKFVVKEQESNQIVFSLAELMILRYLVDNRTIKLSEAQELTQITASEVKRSCMQLSRIGLLETVGKEYTLTAKGYSAIKSDVKYTQDKIVQYIRAKGRILDYLETNEYITNLSVRELCGYTKQQARATIDRLKAEGELRMVGKGKGSKYCRVKKQSE